MVRLRSAVPMVILNLLSIFPIAASAQTGISIPGGATLSDSVSMRLSDGPRFQNAQRYLVSVSAQDKEATADSSDGQQAGSNVQAVASLRNGIQEGSLQRAIAKREIADPNMVFLTTAVNHDFSYVFNSPMVWKTWESPNVRYRPLYFEDENLERYGHHAGHYLQPYKSALHYGARVVTLPYQMATQGCHDCEYGLGYFRPGNCNPACRHGIECSKRGLVVQALTMGAILGL